MNNYIFNFFYSLSHQYAFADDLIVFFAVYFPFVVVIFGGLFLLFHHEILRAENPLRAFLAKKREVIFVFFTSFLAYFVSVLLKILFHTLRPFAALPEVTALFTETGYAFPSGHATFFSALAFSIFFLHVRAGYIFMFFAVVIGLARVIAGVHFPVDILGGLILGALVAYSLRNV